MTSTILPGEARGASNVLEAARARLDRLAKPPGSLGRLEDLAARLCAIQGVLNPQTRPRRLVLFAGDHGVAAEGVSAWPSAVTGVMVDCIVRGKAASSALAAATDTELSLIDVGTQAPSLAPRPGYEARKIASGTRNLAREPALTVLELDQALALGAEAAQRAQADGMRMVATGEMGIGNTTPASCLAMLLAGIPVDQAVGRGAGADDATLDRKYQVVQHAVERARPLLEHSPRAAIAGVAGFEIGAMAGFYAECARLSLPVIVDGVIATASALVAETLYPGASRVMIAAHQGAEPAHAPMLLKLGLTPLLSDWSLRLGEGTGALLAFPLLDAAAAIITRMATLDELQIGPSESAPS